MSSRACLLAASLLLPAATPALGAAPDCRPARAIELMVRFAGQPPQRALLRSSGTGLALEDSHGGAQLWSAGPDAGAFQRFGEMTAGFGESLFAIHLDTDGLHDRLYAGDRAGRLWRFELAAGARPEHWLRGGIWADLGLAEGGRGFIAAPDVALVNLPGTGTRLNVALGSATTGEFPVENRFYFLRDTLAAQLPPQLLTEADLLPLSPLRAPPDISRAGTDEVRGYYLPLGHAQVFAPALTLAGRTHFTVVETAQPLAVHCADGAVPTRPVALSVTILRTADGAATGSNGEEQHDPRDLRRSLPRALPADTRVDVAPSVAGDNEQRRCEAGGEPLPGCMLDTAPRPAGWRREDVD